MVLIARWPLCRRAAEAGGHTPRAPAWMCIACLASSRPLVVPVTVRTVPLRRMTTSPVPVTRLVGTGPRGLRSLSPAGPAAVVRTAPAPVFLSLPPEDTSTTAATAQATTMAAAAIATAGPRLAGAGGAVGSGGAADAAVEGAAAGHEGAAVGAGGCDDGAAAIDAAVTVGAAGGGAGWLTLAGAMAPPAWSCRWSATASRT